MKFLVSWHSLESRAIRCALLLLAMGGTMLGCADLDSALKTSEDTAGPHCSSNDDGKTWHLGTGHIEDIKRLAPGFFTPGNGRWRRQGLASEVGGVSEITPVIVEGSEAFELITKDVPYRVRAIRLDDKTGILATPGQCPQVTAIDHCVDHRLRTEVQVAGTAPCMGPISVPKNQITITMGNNEHPRETLVFGEPLLVAGHTVGVFFSLYLSGSKEPAGRVDRTVNDFSKALPEEVLAMLRHGYEVEAGLLYRNVPGDLKTTEADRKIAEVRVALATKAAAAVTTPQQLGALIKSHPLGILPGDETANAAIAARIQGLIDERIQAEPAPQTLFDIALFVRLSEAITDYKPNVAALEPKYGPLLNQSGFNEPKYQGSFMVLLPNSKYTKVLEAEDATNAQQGEVDAKKQGAARDTEDAWIEVQGRGDELASLAYKISFGRQNFAQSRHNQRGLASMQKYREGLVRDAFCPAKRAFLKAAGATEYSRRAATHCSEEAPTDVGVGGVEKTLTTECRAAFATGC
jgi:hypothetical protein